MTAVIRQHPVLPCFRVLLAGCLALSLPGPLAGQIPGFPAKSNDSGKVSAPETELTEDEKTRQWLVEAREMLARLEDPAAEAMLPEGIKPSSLATRKRDVEQMILALNRHLKSLQAHGEYRAALDAARAALEKWNGFPDSPPYSMLLLDELENQLQAFEEKQASHLSSKELFKRTLESLNEESSKTRENLRRQNTAADGGDAAAAWRAESARIKLKFLAARRVSLVSHIANLRIQAETIQAELDLTRRKIAALRGNVVFSEEDFAKIEAVTADRQATLRKEITALRKRQQEAAAERVKAQEAHQAALRAVPDGEPVTTPEVMTALARLEAADARADALQFIQESLEWLLQLEALVPPVWQERMVLAGNADRHEQSEAILSLQNVLERLKGWESVTANELSSVHADLSKLDARLSAISPDDPRLAVINGHRATLWERQAAVQRVSQAVTLRYRMLERWINDYRSRKRTWTERLGDAWHTARGGVDRFLSIEVLRYQKGEGTGEESMRALTLGRLFGAFFLFLIPYLVANRIIRRLQGISIRRGHIGEAQARTLLNWMMIVVGFLLALSSLKFLDIPLTVFAFLGGALAIGLGFGTQTLIKNFISGIIVLFERKIRVGDILDVDGIIGTVTEINTRSSVVRSVDGVETMVPNSMFLENRVTNLTLTNRRNRRSIRVGVAYGTPPPAVIEVLKECAGRHGLILKDPEPLVLFEDFGDNALVFAVYFWVEFNEKTNAAQVASDVRIMIDKRFNELGIGVPYPQRDMHLITDRPLHVELMRAAEDQPS